MCTALPSLPGRCYPVIEGRFLAGGYPYNPGSDEPLETLRILLSHQVNSFIDLTEEDELAHYDNIFKRITDKEIAYFRFPIVDYSIPTNEEMHQIITCINTQLAENNKIYLHCRGGIGRTGTVVACWLKSQGSSGEEALEKLAFLFSRSNAARFCRSPESQEQINFVLNYCPQPSVADGNKP